MATPTPSSTTVASQVPFTELCAVCDKINGRKGRDKNIPLRRFVEKWREFHNKIHPSGTTTTDSFYPAMRLLMPFYDKDRGAYGIKETKLASHYIKLLCLSKESSDAQKLLNFNSPHHAKGAVGDFADVAYFVLKNRTPEKGSLTIEDVNEDLDSIAENTQAKNKEAMEKSLMHLLTNLSALEQKWLIRMILKQMKLGMSEHTIFHVFHPDAQDLYDVNNSLLKVCQTLHDPTVRLNEIEVTLFSPFRPMLAEVANPDKVDKFFQHGFLYAETKHDGERIQLHMDGDKFMYFSRNGNDFTANFGTNSREGTLSRYIRSCFDPNVKSCILDGEMVCYSSRLKCTINKGENVDVKYLKEDAENQPCYFVFDILMLNGEILTNRPITERTNYMTRLFEPLEGRIQLTSRREITSKQQAIDRLNESIDNREEGIMVKKPDSVYKLNTRKAGWYKLKPEYVDGLIDELDLLIIGGNFGEGRRRGLISHFVLGLAVKPEKKGDHPIKFHSFARVGSGYTLKELYELCLKLNEHWRPYDARSPPASIEFGSGSKERPDLWIEPNKSHIVQVKAAEILKSDRFMVGCTLRFPRVEKVRYDKPWYECMEVEQLEELRQQADGKLARRMMSDDGEGESPKKKKRAVTKIEKPLMVAAHFRGIDVSNVTKVGKMFEGMEMCVVNGPDEHTKHDLERMIVERDGTIVQNPGPSTLCVIAQRNAIRVNNFIKANVYDIVKSGWLLNCIEQNRFLEWRPMDMIHISPTTSKKMAVRYDKYGDGFTHPATTDSLQFSFAEIERLYPAKTYPQLTNDEIAKLEHEYFPNTSQLGIFRTCRAYFDRYQTVQDSDMPIKWSSLELVELKYSFYGGSVQDHITSATTHVVVHSSDLPRLESIKAMNRKRGLKFHLVSEEWVMECLKEKTRLSERPYEQ